MGDVARRVITFERQIVAVRDGIVRHGSGQDRRIEDRRGIVDELRSRVRDRVRQPVREALPHARFQSVVARRADIVPVQTHRGVFRIGLQQLRDRNDGIAQRRGSRDDAEVRVRDAVKQRRSERELFDLQLIEIAVGDPDVRDVRADVRQLHRRVRRELALKRCVPLLHVARTERLVDSEDALAEAGRRRRRDWCDARAVSQHERRRDGVERALRHRLKERKRRRRERRRDAGHLDPHEAVAGAHDRLVRESVHRAEARAEIVLLQRPNGVGAGILELPRFQVEHGGLSVDFGGGKIQRVAHSRIDREAARHLPIVLNEVLLSARSFLNLLLLQIDRKTLHLSEQEARERRSGIAHAGQIAADRIERERTGRRRRLNHVQALPAPVQSHLQSVAPPQPCERVRDLRHARVEIRGGVRGRSELLIAADEKRRQRVRELRVRRDSRNAERGARGFGEPGRGSRNGASRVADPEFVQRVVRERVLMIRRERPRLRVLRSERRGHDAAAIRKRRDRNESIGE